MSRPRSHPPAPDQAERDRLTSEFGTNFLVEAGAGSGKTESLAQRMAAGIANGTWEPEGMAAVTFTRKAAAESRGRVQLALEGRLAASRPDSAEHANVARGLASIERIFAGTIHAFCARLLRERPVEARVAPGFRELDDLEDARLRRQCWRDFLARARAIGSAPLAALQATGVRPVDLDGAFARVCEHDDVVFAAVEVPAPPLAPTWLALDVFWRDLTRLLPPALDPATTCKVQALVPEFTGRLRFVSRQRPSLLAALLAEWDHENHGLVNKWWGTGQSRGNAVAAEAKALVERFRDAVARPWLGLWRQHVYRLAIDVLLEARAFYAARRRSLNVVNYTDLLVVTARMLREQPDVRRQLQRKFRWLFVDEFQDTDPVQAELLLWLASAEPAGEARPGQAAEAWSVDLRPGALFVVGDPKQSIYRFRRADIDVYTAVRDRIVGCGGEVVGLTANFRSLPGACALANVHFPPRFATETPHSPAFQPLRPVRSEADPDVVPGPRLATLTTPATVAKNEVAAVEADGIARYIRGEVDAGRRRYGDFLVLTRQRPRLHLYAGVLDGYGIPIEVSGGGRFGQSQEVTSLALLLRALADPADHAALVGALRGRFFGLSDEALFAYRAAGGRLDLSAPLPAEDDPAEVARQEAVSGPVLRAMRALRRFESMTRRLPLGVAVEDIVEQTGWLALASTSEGGAGGGHVLQAVDRVREVAEQGGGLLEAVEALTAEEESSEAESLPLEPGRRDVVRVMNLHKAKGLEAPVVFLVDPVHAYRFPIDLRVVRERGQARGYLLVQRQREGDYGATPIAYPAGWDVHEREEGLYREAEQHRLLYVASTRARDLLVVSRWDKPAASGRNPNEAWGEFDGSLRRAGATELVVPEAVPAALRPAADLSAAQQALAAQRRQRAHEMVRCPSSAVRVVTTEAERFEAAPRRLAQAGGADTVRSGEARSRWGEEREPGTAARQPSLVVLSAGGADALRAIVPDTPSHRADRDAAWGVLLHGLLEHAMRASDREVTVEELTRLAQWLVVERDELRDHVAEAVAIVIAAMRAPFWREAQAGEHHVEVPFAVRLDVGEEAPGGERVEVPTILRGVIDLVHTAAGGWQVRDYKTGALDAQSLMTKYGRQLETYRWVWERWGAGRMGR